MTTNSAELKAEFHWLVELRPAFEGHPSFQPTYYAGWMESPIEAARTHDVYASPKFTSKEDADRVAKKLGHTLSCVWEAIEHGFHGRTAAQGDQSKAADFHGDGLGLAVFLVIRPGMVPRIGRPSKDIIASLREWFAANQDAEIYVLRSWADEVGCQCIENGRELLQMEGDELPSKAGSAEQVSEREAFERQANDARFFPAEINFTRTKSPSGRDEYANSHLQSRWEGWIARAALSAPERKVTDAEIAKMWAAQRKYHGGEPCKLGHIEFARALLNQQGEQTAPEGWQSIETAPKDGTPILLGRAESEFHAAESTVGWWQEAVEDGVDYMGGDAGFVDFAFQVFNPGRSFGNPSHMYAADQPTHWMPLPAAPSTAQKDG